MKAAVGTTLPLPTWAALAVCLSACDLQPKTAVIAMHGVGDDQVYLSTMADSLAALPRPVRVEVFNPAMDPMDTYADALRTAEEVTRLEGLVGVVGHRDSRSTLVVGPIYRDAGIPLVVPNATSSAIQSLGSSVFRLVPDDREQGQFLGETAEAMGARRIMIFHVGDEYGAGIRNGVLEGLPHGIEVLRVVEYGLRRSSCPGDFQPFVDAALQDGEPDVVILGSRPRDAGCVAHLIHQHFPNVRFLAADGVEPSPEFLGAAGDAVSQVALVQFYREEDNPGLQAFRARYEATSGGRWDSGVPLRMDGVGLLREAVREVGADPRAVEGWLRGLGTTHPPFRGLTGTISFAPGVRRPLYLVDAQGEAVPWAP